MKRITHFFITAVLFAVLVSCSEIEEVDDFDEISKKHQSIAIFPFWVNWYQLDDDSLIDKNVDEKKKASRAFQKTFYEAFTQRENNKIQVQKTQQTNQVLEDLKAKKQFNKENLLNGVLIGQLGVNAIILGNARLYPSNTGVLENRAKLFISIVEGTTGEKIWESSQEISSETDDLETLMNDLIVLTAKDFPYLDE